MIHRDNIRDHRGAMSNHPLLHHAWRVKLRAHHIDSQYTLLDALTLFYVKPWQATQKATCTEMTYKDVNAIRT